MRNRKLKTYSIKGLMLLAFGFMFINLSWKTSKNQPTTQPINTLKDSIPAPITKQVSFSNYVNSLYETTNLKAAGLALPVFEKAVTGFMNMKSQNRLNQDKSVVTIVDFTKPSTAKRMWIVDLKNKTLLLNTYVAHGQGSGENMATTFSNIAESHQSSLGFYIANETYFGKHGLSLKLDGQDKGINDLARERAIVLHGANYVSEDFIKNTGRLGRSFGCPAVSRELNDKVIALIKGKTCFFINGNSDTYRSNLLATTHLEQNFSELASL
ncbi:MAG TPA: murein L,D-transpeptidase catalytic domain family protein [Pelobium sp.]|nr:murein L,D-transpeptidase catalytic domain family protein [Pelobium sp.]